VPGAGTAGSGTVEAAGRVVWHVAFDGCFLDLFAGRHRLLCWSGGISKWQKSLRDMFSG
jgi:hypothetical protein